MTQTGMAATTCSNEENVALKAGSPKSIKNAGFAARKPSDASQFSLSMFPPTPTTPLHGDIVWAGLNSANSPLRQAFFSSHQSLSPSPVGLAPPSSPWSLRPLPSSDHHQSAPSTPVRRASTRAGHQSHPTYTRNRPKRASADPPTHHGRNRVGSVTSAISLGPGHHSLGVVQYQGPFGYASATERRQKQPRKRSNTVASSGSDSVYSQDQDRESESCYSDDDAASMASSVEEAIMMAQEERRFSRQSRLAYMRDSPMSESGRELSLESHASSYSSSGSPEQSAGPVTPDEPGGYPVKAEKTTTPLVRLERPNAGLPTVNIIPPGRKSALRMSTTSGSTVRHLPRAVPEPELKPLRPSPSMFSLRSRGTRKARPPGKIMISHPHLNAGDTLGAEVLPQCADIGASRATLTTDGGVGVRSITHSKSMPALRTPSLVSRNVLEKKHKGPKPPFDKYGMPSEEQLRLASEMNVYDDRGQPVRFGDIFERQKTAICFIRHFWCPLCQDYMSSIVHLTEPSFVKKAGVKLVIIGNGSPSMIKAYRDNIFRCPYEMYTDPSRRVYNALGMNLRTTDRGSKEEKGSYVKHGTFTGNMMALKNALKMPIANAGDIKQLGGEFILGPGLTCSFTSRMHTTRSHAPIRDLLQAAGVDTNPWATDLSFVRPEADKARWVDIQSEDLDRLIRRGLQASCGEQYCTLDDEVDGTGELDLGEFRRLLEYLKGEVSIPTPKLEPEPEPKPEPVCPAPVAGPSYEIEVKGRKRIELDHLGAVLQSRNESSTWEVRRDRKRSTSRPGTATSRPGTATSRPGTAKSTVSVCRI
ncbi:hypothetical protein FRC10_010715 [Ceratobasidium sp. 414]|nr:hypothetical protein FRC10_010715 [Ceratobasidium sp. 414]